MRKISKLKCSCPFNIWKKFSWFTHDTSVIQGRIHTPFNVSCPGRFLCHKDEDGNVILLCDARVLHRQIFLRILKSWCEILKIKINITLEIEHPVHCFMTNYAFWLYDGPVLAKYFDEKNTTIFPNYTSYFTP